jgi:long-subunit fatty acid transport protein
MRREVLHKRQVRLLGDRHAGALILIVCTSLACRVAADIPIAPEPVGSGARALGQSAFIAVADDATAASWNPAGLINLERPEASFVGVWKTITNDLSAVDSSLSMNQDSWDETEINFMSYALPLEIGNTDAVLSVNYHQVYDLTIEREYEDIRTHTTHKSKGALSAYSLAGGLSVPGFPELAFGASFNWYAPSIFRDYVRRAVTSDAELTTIDTLDSIWGYNFTFGLLLDAYERDENLLTVGLVCHTPFTAELDGRRVEITPATEEDTGGWSAKPLGPWDIDFPLSLGAGVNYRFSDQFSTAIDVQWTDWSDFKYTGAATTPSSDAVSFRLGGEYLTFFEGASRSVLAYRGGIFYEPRPAWDGTLPVYGLSLGLGWTVKERFSLDFAYQFRWGEGDGFTVNDAKFDYGVQEHWFIGSVVVYFR